jgi:hypothetical protein
MTTLDLSHVRTHDLGGQPAGPIDRTPHEPEPWHRLVTAVVTAVRERRRAFTVDEMRRAMEDMPAEDYRRIGYFDRWAVGLATLAVEKGLLTADELKQRLAALEAKR